MARFRVYILLLLCLSGAAGYVHAQDGARVVTFDFYTDKIDFVATSAAQVTFTDTLSPATIRSFYKRIDSTNYTPLVDALLQYRKQQQPDDWVYYQLVRKMAQTIAPKTENYNRYTLYKWFLLCKSGYNATLNVIGDRLLIYVQSNDEIYDIPFFNQNGKRYTCLNYHDYNYNIDFASAALYNVGISMTGAEKPFSYKLTRLPEFGPESYYDKELRFTYRDIEYKLNVKMNGDVKKIFVNYPVVDYQLYFDAPLSRKTYASLISQLQQTTSKMSVTEGVEYLMYFTRYAFSYQADSLHFGRVKHMSPEQTLLYDSSDCADRSALFYCLVKEIYHLPMVVVAFPHHLTIAVKLDKPVGMPIVFNGNVYSFCEPTPQTEDLVLGSISTDLRSVAYEIVYSYSPPGK